MIKNPMNNQTQLNKDKNR